jgi:hypothetical protein
MRVFPPPSPALVVLVGLAIMAAAPARAIGPDLSLTFRDSFERLDLLIDPEALGELSVSWILYDRGEIVREERLEVRPERAPGGDLVAEVPLDLDRLSDLKPGYYALKIVAVETPPKGEVAEALRIDQWVHVLVSESGIHRVTQEEYSGALEPMEFGIDANGERVPLFGGSGGEASIPLDKTEHHEAPALGLGGGAVEERRGEDRQFRSRDESGEP